MSDFQIGKEAIFYFFGKSGHEENRGKMEPTKPLGSRLGTSGAISVVQGSSDLGTWYLMRILWLGFSYPLAEKCWL